MVFPKSYLQAQMRMRIKVQLKLAQLVAGSDEDHVHRAHAAAHRVGGGELNERGPDEDAHHVGSTEDGQGQERQREGDELRRRFEIGLGDC